MSELNKKNIKYGALNRFYQDLKSHDLKSLNDKIDDIDVPEYTAGEGIDISDDTISCTYEYSLPTASNNTLGGVKVGDNLAIDNNTSVLTAQNFNLTKSYSRYGVKMNAGLGFQINDDANIKDGAFVFGLCNTIPNGWTTLGRYTWDAYSNTMTKVSGELPATTGVYVRAKGININVRVEKIEGDVIYLSDYISYAAGANQEVEICRLWNNPSMRGVIFGECCETRNEGEIAFGKFNASHKNSNSSSANSDNTTYSIGIGRSGDYMYGVNRKNAVEIMQNGDMYIKGVGGYDGAHIKSETGYESTKTLQEVIDGKVDSSTLATKANQTDFVVPVDMATTTYDWSALDGFDTTGIYRGVARAEYMGMTLDMAAMNLSVVSASGIIVQSVIICTFTNGTNNIAISSRQSSDGGTTWSSMTETGLPSLNDDASVSSAVASKTTYSRSKIDSLISALDQRLTAMGG